MSVVWLPCLCQFGSLFCSRLAVVKELYFGQIGKSELTGDTIWILNWKNFSISLEIDRRAIN